MSTLPTPAPPARGSASSPPPSRTVTFASSSSSASADERADLASTHLASFHATVLPRARTAEARATLQALFVQLQRQLSLAASCMSPACSADDSPATPAVLPADVDRARVHLWRRYRSLAACVLVTADDFPSFCHAAHARPDPARR